MGADLEPLSSVEVTVTGGRSGTSASPGRRRGSEAWVRGAASGGASVAWCGCVPTPTPAVGAPNTPCTPVLRWPHRDGVPAQTSRAARTPGPRVSATTPCGVPCPADPVPGPHPAAAWAPRGERTSVPADRPDRPCGLCRCAWREGSGARAGRPISCWAPRHADGRVGCPWLSLPGRVPHACASAKPTHLVACGWRKHSPFGAPCDPGAQPRVASVSQVRKPRRRAGQGLCPLR